MTNMFVTFTVAARARVQRGLILRDGHVSAPSKAKTQALRQLTCVKGRRSH